MATPAHGHQPPVHPLVMPSLDAEAIVWLDHCEPSNENVWWQAEDVAKIEGPSTVDCVGYVVREEADWLAIVNHITDDGCCSQPTVILKNCIISRRKMRAKKKQR